MLTYFSFHLIGPVNLLCSGLQVRVTNLPDASEHIGEVLKRVKKEHLKRAYKITDWLAFLFFLYVNPVSQLFHLLLSFSSFLFYPILVCRVDL